mmetsp:Transcript_39713/g.83493  ORF Transcript_39713/g.83493 Transcript_39713/m.83493 type:complete len:169 (-) Transcript_39713:3-509(-)
MNDVNTNCKCRGIIYLQIAIHPMARGNRNAFGREDYTFNKMSALVSKNPWNHSFVWASPPALDMIMMNLAPDKPDRQKFDPFVLDEWHLADLKAISKLNKSGMMFYSEQFEVSTAYMGLSCDGMHFGASHDRVFYGCGGMSVVTDVLTQLWLHRVLVSLPTAIPLDIC